MLPKTNIKVQNKRVKRLSFLLLFRAQNAKYNHQQKSTPLRYRWSHRQKGESDTWLVVLVTGVFCWDNKCIHPTQQIFVFTLQAFNRVTCCDEHKLFWAQFPLSDTFDSSHSVCNCLRENKHVTLCTWSSFSYTLPPYARHKDPVQKYSASQRISPGRALLFTELLIMKQHLGKTGCG